MIKNSYGNLYIGITDNPERRLKEHNTKQGASFTRSGDLSRVKSGDKFEIVFLEKQDSLKKLVREKFKLKNGEEIKKKD